jgi:hypothetical protein
MIGSTVYGFVTGQKMLNEAKRIKPIEADYDKISSQQLDPSNPVAQFQGMAQMQLNARNPFAAAQQRGILGSQANAMAGAQRAVTDPSQALAMTAALQANTDQALFGQAGQEQQDYQRRFSNLAGALQSRTDENRFRFGTAFQKYQMDMDRKTALQNAGRQSQQQAIKGLEDGAIKIAGMLINPAGAAAGAASSAASGAAGATGQMSSLGSQFGGGQYGFSNSLLYQPRGIRGMVG